MVTDFQKYIVITEIAIEPQVQVDKQEVDGLNCGRGSAIRKIFS
jgi:hypothetical protein